MFFWRKRKGPSEPKPIQAEDTERVSQHLEEKEIEKPPIQEKPRICAIDIEENCVKELTSHGFNCYPGTLGHMVEVPNTIRHSEHQCLLDFDFPPNLHEYDIVIIDLQNPMKIKYIEEDHTYSQRKGYEQLAFMSSFPETLFDARAFSAIMLSNGLRSFWKKESIMVVFASNYEKIEYHPIFITSDGVKRLNAETYSFYDFYSNLPDHENKIGKDTTVIYKRDDELRALLKRHKEEARYRIIFYHPTHWDGKKMSKMRISFL